MASPLLEQRTHTLTVEVPRRGLLVDGDPTRLSQVVSNLLTNAAKYTPPGGRITVRARARSTTRSCCRVRDTGIGIAPEVLPRIFDLFVQERQALDRSQGGLGIGLTIVRNLVERHGGSVSARSDGPGQGQRVHRPLAGGATADGRPRRRARGGPDDGAAATPRRAASSSSTTTRTRAEMLAEALAQRATTRASPTTRRRRCAWPRSSRPTSPSSTSACR